MHTREERTRRRSVISMELSQDNSKDLAESESAAAAIALSSLFSPTPSPSGIDPSPCCSLLQGSLQLQDYRSSDKGLPSNAHGGFDEEADHLPVVDFGLLVSESEAERTNSLKQMVGACKQWGLFRLVNHGVPVALMQEIDKQARKVFSLPLEVKQRGRPSEADIFGYVSGSDSNYTLRSNWHEVLRLPADKNMREAYVDKIFGHDQYKFSATADDYLSRLEDILIKLLEVLTIALGLNRSELSQHCGKGKENSSRVRFNYYPPCPEPLSVIGMSPHSDPFILTILQQDEVGGLQILKNDKWMRVQPQSNSFLVIVGDTLQVWSNDTYTRLMHRVLVNSKEPRMSIAFFLLPKAATRIEAIAGRKGGEAGEVDSSGAPVTSKYRSYTFEEYIAAAQKVKSRSTIEQFRSGSSR